jgi:hypothetical protein
VAVRSGVGPDVESGNVGQCTGSLNTPGQFAGLPALDARQCAGTSLARAWGGHVNAIPAMACYFALGGLPDGTGGQLPFDARACFRGGEIVPVEPSVLQDAGGVAGAGGGTQGNGRSGGCGCRLSGIAKLPAGAWLLALLAALAGCRWRRP